jgi:hypothetical protein
MGLELPAPGRQNTEKTREVCADEPRVCGAPFAGGGRGVAHSVVRETLLRADAGAERLRNGAGDEEGWPGKLFLQVVMEPLLGFRLLPLGAVALATGMLDAVVLATAWALREAVAVMAAAAILDGADDFAVRGREVGIALKVCGRKGGAARAQGGHGKSPCMRAWRRSEASSWPVGVRCK